MNFSGRVKYPSFETHCTGVCLSEHLRPKISQSRNKVEIIPLVIQNLVFGKENALVIERPQAALINIERLAVVQSQGFCKVEFQNQNPKF